MKNNHFFTKRVLANLLVVAVGIILYLGLSNFQAVSAVIRNFVSVISPFITGVAIAYLLNMPTRFFETKVFKRFRKRRVFSLLTTYFLALLVMALLIGMIVPQLIDSISTLLGSVQAYFDNINALIGWLGSALDLDLETTDAVMVSYTDLVNQLLAYIRSVLPELLNLTMRIGTGIVSALTAVISSVYMLAGKPKLIRQCRKVLYAVLPKRPVDNLMRIGHLSNSVFAGFIGGKIVDSLIIGAICFVFMTLVNLTSIEMPYALLISVIIGVTNIIPFFGPFIGAIPSALILLMVNPWSALWFILFIIVLQQFDGNLLGPKILGNSTGLPAMWVLIAIVVGGGLFGFMGMLLGVPTAAILHTLTSEFVKARLQKKGLTDEDTQKTPHKKSTDANSTGAE